MAIKKKKVYQVGDIIPVEGELKDLLKHVAEPMKAAFLGIKLAQEIYYDKLEDFWGIIHERYPGLKYYKLTYNNKGDFIIVMPKQEDLPDMLKYLKERN